VTVDNENVVQLLVFLLSVAVVTFNLFVLGFVLWTRPQTTSIVQNRPLARGALKGVIWIVRINTIGVAWVAIAAVLRNRVTLPIAEHVASDAFWWIVISQYVVAFSLPFLPGVLLYFMVDAFLKLNQNTRHEVTRRYADLQADALTGRRRRGGDEG
jgi:hypothetical protein